MSKFNHNNPNSSKKVNKNTNDLIREKLREGEVIGTSLPYGNCLLSYGKFKEYELVITINDNRVIKVEEF
tara:strand:+ start:291 stop:500 length:210 start_codon:yes stop_codon:yes gene_type:complete